MYQILVANGEETLIATFNKLVGEWNLNLYTVGEYSDATF